jgi:hypothetical protein
MIRYPLRKRAPARGENAVALAALLLASVLVIFAVILAVSKLTAPASRPSVRPSVALRDDSIEKVFIGRAGEIGFLLRGTGPAAAGKFRSAVEANVLALGPGEMVARIDAYNFSGQPVKLVDGGWTIRIGEAQWHALPSKGDTDPPSPLHAALAGGDPDAELAPFTARRIGLVGLIQSFDQGDTASLRRGAIAEDVVLVASKVSERQLAEFDRMPTLSVLEKLSGDRSSGAAQR